MLDKKRPPQQRKISQQLDMIQKCFPKVLSKDDNNQKY